MKGHQGLVEVMIYQVLKMQKFYKFMFDRVFNVWTKDWMHF